MKTCSKCGQAKPLSDFRKTQVHGKDALRPECRSCESVRSNIYNKAHPQDVKARWDSFWGKNKERLAAKHLLHIKANPELNRKHARIRRARVNGQTEHFTPQEWENLKTLYENICLACGAETILEPDHIQPISRGGADTIDNIQPLCRACNISKRAKTVDYRYHEIHRD